VLGSKLPLFFAIVILLSMLLLFVIFRSLVIPLQCGRGDHGLRVPVVHAR
jgi:hypothetical protein